MSQVPLGSSIIYEANQNVKMPTDIDSFLNKYIDRVDDNSLSVIFNSFQNDAFDKNYFILLQESNLVQFKNRWIMRPDYVSYDYYKTVIYWPLILYVNNIYCIEEFKNLDAILVPPFTSILELSKHRKIDENIIELIETKSNSFTNSHYIRYPLDEYELKRREALKVLTDNTGSGLDVYTAEKIEHITLTSTMINNQYLDLEYEPTNNSTLSLSVNNFSIGQRYNYDYTLTAATDGKIKRISWKSSDILESSNVQIKTGMRRFIKAGDILHIKYTLSVVYKISDGPPSL